MKKDRMPNTHKKSIKIIIVAVLVAVIIAVGIFQSIWNSNADKSNSGSQVSASDWYVDFTFNRSYSNIGVLFYENNLIRFYDAESGVNVPVCDKADCTHTSSSCQAYQETIAHIVTDGDLLLYVAEDGDVIGNGGIYEADLNGANRKRIASYESLQEITAMQVTDEWILLSYYNQYDENMELMDETETGLYAYNRLSGDGKVIWSEYGYNARIKTIDIYEGSIYASYSYYSLTANDVVEHADDEAYIWENRHRQLRVLSYDGECDEILLQDEFYDIFTFSGNGFFYSCKSDSDSESEVYYYHLENGDRTYLANDLLAVRCPIEGISILYGGGGETNRIYRYDVESGKLEVIVEDMGNTILDGVFADYTYAWNFDTEDGYGVFCYLKTKDLLNGNYELTEFTEE